METHRITRNTAKVPDIWEILLIVADEKNREEWKKGKVVRHIFEEKMELSEEYRWFTRVTTLKDRLTSSAHGK